MTVMIISPSSQSGRDVKVADERLWAASATLISPGLPSPPVRCATALIVEAGSGPTPKSRTLLTLTPSRLFAATMGDASDNPDLQSILSTLARYAQVSHASDTAFPHIGADSNVSDSPRQVAQGRPCTDKPQPLTGTQDQIAAVKVPTNPSLQPIDPATITTWQDGLRCVTKIAAQDPRFGSRIKQMMADQKSQELRWYTERQSLKHKQATRTSSTMKANSILQSLNPSFVATPAHGQSEAEMMAEIAAFDRSVYIAQEAMNTAMSAELKSLGVPFFGTRSDLLISAASRLSTTDQLGDRPRWSPPITEADLSELRKRIISHLEDLYRD